MVFKKIRTHTISADGLPGPATQLPAATRYPSSDGGGRAMSPATHYSLFIVHYSLFTRFAPCAITCRAFSPRKFADNETTRVTQFANLHIGTFAKSPQRPIFIITYSLFPITYSLNSTFSAKERDAETGLSYFGARYYSSDLSVWLSVDPMSGKYPSLSPYVYCADNPVKLVDPNGESFETEIDIENKTITIKATYYTINENRDLLQKGVDVWNSQSGKYSYVMGEGESEIVFSIIFDLTIADGDFKTISDIPSSLSGNQNYFEVIPQVLVDNNEVRGRCSGNIISVSSNWNLDFLDMPRTAAHEIGHSLGCSDYSFYRPSDLMVSGGFGSSITIRDIRSIMFMGGYDSLGETNAGGLGKCCDNLQLNDFMGKLIKK